MPQEPTEDMPRPALYAMGGMIMGRIHAGENPQAYEWLKSLSSDDLGAIRWAARCLSEMADAVSDERQSFVGDLRRSLGR